MKETSSTKQKQMSMPMFATFESPINRASLGYHHVREQNIKKLHTYWAELFAIQQVLHTCGKSSLV
jgi:hypothetical protein